MVKSNTYLDSIHEAVASIVVTSEYETAKNNQQFDNSEYESCIDMLECIRTDKDYDWLSNYHIPEMNAIFHTESAGWVAQYFPTRDFVEVKLDGEDELDRVQARAAKKLLNKTLNQRDMYYYPKVVRLRGINSLTGRGYILARWERDTVKDEVQGKPDEYGNIPEPTYSERVIKDQFNFDVIDPRNVFTDNRYCYSIQEKDWVTIRYEGDYEGLKARASEGFINLDKLKDVLDGKYCETDTARETYNKNSDKTYIEKTPVKRFDVIDRYGRFWAIVKESDAEEGYPTEIEIGLDENGEVKDGAELVECIVTFALQGNHRILIRFVATPFIDSNGKPFKPIVRSLCYVHPSKDDGLSDGRHMRELQVAINDTFNMASDRTKLATLPTFKGRKDALDDADIFFEPEHVIQLENMDDLQEIAIRDDVSGALTQLGVLANKMQGVMAVFPPDMGGMPEKTSVTATAIAGAASSHNTRSNYKSMTFEYTFYQEFYWLILQMTYRFAKTETALKLMGQDAYVFDADADYTYTPLSSNIETEHGKYKKIQLIDQMIGRMSGLVQIVPELLPVIAKLVGQSVELLGAEHKDIADMINKIAKAKVQPQEGKGGNNNMQQIADMGGEAMSNQNGSPMSTQEMMTRDMSNRAGGSIY